MVILIMLNVMSSEVFLAVRLDIGVALRISKIGILNQINSSIAEPAFLLI